MAFTVTTMQLLYDWAMDLNGSPYVWGGHYLAYSYYQQYGRCYIG